MGFGLHHHAGGSVLGHQGQVGIGIGVIGMDGTAIHLENAANLGGRRLAYLLGFEATADFVGDLAQKLGLLHLLPKSGLGLFLLNHAANPSGHQLQQLTICAAKGARSHGTAQKRQRTIHLIMHRHATAQIVRQIFGHEGAFCPHRCRKIIHQERFLQVRCNPA